MRKLLTPLLFATCFGIAACSTAGDPEPMAETARPIVNVSGQVWAFDEFGYLQSPEGVEIALGSAGTLKTLTTAEGMYRFSNAKMPGAERFLKAVDVSVLKEGFVDVNQAQVNLEFPCTFNFQLHKASTSVVSALQAQVEGAFIVVRGVLTNSRAKAGNEVWVTLFVGIDNTNISASQSDKTYNFPVTCAGSGVPTAFTYRIPKNDFQRYENNNSKLTLLAYGNIPLRDEFGHAYGNKMLTGDIKYAADGQSYYFSYPGLGPLPSEKITFWL